MVGLWRPQKKGKSLCVMVEPFTPLGEETRTAIQSEAGRMAPMLGSETVAVTFASADFRMDS